MPKDKKPVTSAAGIKLRASPLPAEHPSKASSPKTAQREFPDQPIGGGGPPATIENVEFLLDRANIRVRYNVIRKRTEIIGPPTGGIPDNSDNTAMTYICSHAARYGIPTGSVPSNVEAIADRYPYNPVAEWITSKSWDGQDRLPSICGTLVTAEDFPSELKRTLIRKWLLSGVAAALLPDGFHARGVLTLQGPQGIGKTSWCRSLIPDPQLREVALKLDHHLDGGNKDSILGAITHWIVEIGELDSSFRRDRARLKGFLTNDHDTIRRPYARKESEYPRRTIFLATVNQSDFLDDHTGNSRWWTLPVLEIDFHHDVDMQQVFAQLACDFEAGEQWWLTPEEERQLSLTNAKHRSFSLIEDRLSDVVHWDAPNDWPRHPYTASELLEKAGIEHPTNPQAKECAAILRESFGEPKRIQGKTKWRVPLRPEVQTDGDQTGGPRRPDKFD